MVAALRRLRSLAHHLAPLPRTAATMTSTTPAVTFPVTPPPPPPADSHAFVKTAAFLCIGDEILNGKTKDTNTHYFAKLCFDVGIDLKRVEVVPDEEDVIVEAARRMVDNYDLVVTSGGIGPTHDDITYQSLAKAFDPLGSLEYHQETLDRMSSHLLSRQSASNNHASTTTPDQVTARNRMALFPTLHAQVLFVRPELWVPVVRLKGKLCILPGVPTLFERLLKSLIRDGYTSLPPPSSKPLRYLILTRMPESSIAPYLTLLSERLKSEGIKVGSYPKFQGEVTVSLIGTNEERLEQLSNEVLIELDGSRVEKSVVGVD